jgi:hypothetical protein
MRSANAIKVHRKSGEAERRDLRFRGPFVEMFFDRAHRSGFLFGSHTDTKALISSIQCGPADAVPFSQERQERSGGVWSDVSF